MVLPLWWPFFFLFTFSLIKKSFKFYKIIIMSLSRPEGETGEVGSSTGSDGNGSNIRITLPKVYGYLTIAQAGTAIVFGTFLVTHLSVPTLAIIGGVDLANR